MDNFKLLFTAFHYKYFILLFTAYTPNKNLENPLGPISLKFPPMSIYPRNPPNFIDIKNLPNSTDIKFPLISTKDLEILPNSLN